MKKHTSFVNVSEIPLLSPEQTVLNLQKNEICFFLECVFRAKNSFQQFQDLDMTKPYAVLVQNFCLTNGISSLTHPSKWDMGKFGASTNEQRRKFRKVFKQVMHVCNVFFETSGIDPSLKTTGTYKLLADEQLKKLPQKRLFRFKKELVQRFFLFNAMLTCTKMKVSDEFMPIGMVFAWNRMLLGDR
jgi:hypothetical protein